uniref:Variable surface lipoprotein W n=1 Tax=Mycoplasmopsis agalactiae TaxID=2110 RepID=A1X5L9_MYCAA|nr:variable surface lipoprotein W precursor [Mycoplasmopsis agalactiae]
MKKSKFLLLGSLSSLAATPFVAAKCGDTKEEEKKPTGAPTETPGGSQKNPGGSQNPGTENGGNSNGNSATINEKKSLPVLISNENRQLGEIKKKDKNSILEALLAKNQSLNLDKSQLDVKDIENVSAVVFAKSDSAKYEGQILVSFTLSTSGTPGNGGAATTTEKKPLPTLISSKNQQLGEIKKKDKNSVLEALLAKNQSLNLDKSQLDVKDIKDGSAVVFAKSDSAKYEGQILVSFTLSTSGTPGNGGAATTTEKKPLPTLISSKNQQLGEIKKKDKNSVLEALLAKNQSLNLDKSQLDVKDIKDGSAVVFAKSDSAKYEGQILVSFTLNS